MSFSDGGAGSSVIYFPECTLGGPEPEGEGLGLGTQYGTFGRCCQRCSCLAWFIIHREAPDGGEGEEERQRWTKRQRQRSQELGLGTLVMEERKEEEWVLGAQPVPTAACTPKVNTRICVAFCSLHTTCLLFNSL